MVMKCGRKTTLIPSRMPVYIVGLLLNWIPTGFALDPNKAITQYIHEAWTTENGLPQNSVKALVQSREGYLWLGTEEGLVRFDGSRFTVFDKRNTPDLKDHSIQCLLEDGADGLWIGTETGGLSRFKDGAFTHYTRQQGLPGNHITAIHQDRQGVLWIGTRPGLSRWQAGSFASYSDRDGLAHNSGGNSPYSNEAAA